MVAAVLRITVLQRLLRDGNGEGWDAAASRSLSYAPGGLRAGRAALFVLKQLKASGGLGALASVVFAPGLVASNLLPWLRLDTSQANRLKLADPFQEIDIAPAGGDFGPRGEYYGRICNAVHDVVGVAALAEKANTL